MKPTTLYRLALTALISIGTLSAGAQSRISHKEYIEKYKHIAIEHQEVYGIPASIKMAQGLLESDCGNSRLATQANNHFGIKCKSDWKGQTIAHDDDALQECFRKYDSAEASYHDHSEFLDNSARYQSLFDLEVTDYKGWAHGLKAAGYATNPRYADLLIKMIEDHQLYLLDSEDPRTSQPSSGWETVIVEVTEPVSGTETAATNDKIDIDNYVVSVRIVSGYQVYSNNGSEFVISNEKDTYAAIAALTGVSEKRLRKFNEAESGREPATGEQIYLKAKSNRATNGKLIHIVQEGETMHSIAQAYGIKLKKLANINRRSADSRLSPGQQIRLM